MRINKNLLKKNKFYVGSNSIFERNLGHETLEEAIEHAADLMKEDEDDKFIVQIVKIVRSERRPVKVEDVE